MVVLFGSEGGDYGGGSGGRCNKHAKQAKEKIRVTSRHM